VFDVKRAAQQSAEMRARLIGGKRREKTEAAAVHADDRDLFAGASRATPSRVPSPPITQHASQPRR